jgi:hypothetical protein
VVVVVVPGRADEMLRTGRDLASRRLSSRSRSGS